LLDEGVASLLKQEDDLSVSGIAYKDKATFLQDLVQARPDVIVWSEQDGTDAARVCELLPEIPVQGAIRVIIVRPDDNQVDVYEKRCVVTTQRRDLITLVGRGQVNFLNWPEIPQTRPRSSAKEEAQ
jgi:hypothetical protein